MSETKYVVGRLEMLVTSELFDFKIDTKFIRKGFLLIEYGNPVRQLWNSRVSF